MFRELHINNFRSFKRFEMRGLGKINLLVGGNNSGKTSLLEAIDLLLAHGEPNSIWTALNRRGERLWDDEDGGSSPEADICRLFHGHEIDFNSEFTIGVKNGHRSQELRASISETTNEEMNSDLFLSDNETSYGTHALRLHWEGEAKTESSPPILLTERGGLSLDALRRRRPLSHDDALPVSFITTSAMSANEVVSLLSRVVLNPEEDLLLRALRIIEPTIERIAPIAVSSRRIGSISKGGVVIKCKDIEKRLPIGTMGDGIWRLLGIILALIQCRGGVLLIDEIDTGLHHSVMNDMWKLVHETSQRLDVQIFATTHSNDCWKSLASTASKLNLDDDQICIHRVEKNNTSSIRLDSQEMRIAAERQFEIR